MINKLLIANINTKLGKEGIKDYYDSSIERIKIYLIVRLKSSIKFLLQEDIDVLDITDVEKEKLIKCVELPNYHKIMEELGAEGKEIIKLFVDELKEYDDINIDTVKEMVDSMAQLLYFEAIKEENKDLNFGEMNFIEKLKEELKENTGDIKNIILDNLIAEIKIDLDLEYGFKTDNLFNMTVTEYEQLQEILKSEDIAEHYILDCLGKKVLDLEFLDDHMLIMALNEIVEDMYYKIIGVACKQKEIYQSFINEIIKSYEEIDNNTIEQIKNNINTLLDFRKLSKTNIL